MHKQMLQRCAQLFSRLVPRPSLAGQGLPERMRTATVALLGVTAAVSMAFVVAIAQQGWTVLSLGPIPAPFVGPQSVGDGTALSTGEGGSVAPTGGRPGLVAVAELTAGSQGAQPGRAPARPPAAGGPSGSSNPVASPEQGGGPKGAPPADGGEGAPGGGGEAPPTSQPGSPGNPPSSGGGKGTAGVGGQQEEDEDEEESSTPPPPPPGEGSQEEVDEEEEGESSGAWWDERGHGRGHHHW